MALERTEFVAARVTKKEAAMVARIAKAQGLTVAEYTRGALFAAMVLDGDIEAMKHTAGIVRARLAERFSGVAARSLVTT